MFLRCLSDKQWPTDRTNNLTVESIMCDAIRYLYSLNLALNLINLRIRRFRITFGMNMTDREQNVTNKISSTFAQTFPKLLKRLEWKGETSLCLHHWLSVLCFPLWSTLTCSVYCVSPCLMSIIWWKHSDLLFTLHWQRQFN